MNIFDKFPQICARETQKKTNPYIPQLTKYNLSPCILAN